MASKFISDEDEAKDIAAQIEAQQKKKKLAKADLGAQIEKKLNAAKAKTPGNAEGV